MYFQNDGLGKVESNMEQGHQGDQTSSVTQRHDSQQQEQQHKVCVGNVETQLSWG